MAFQDRSELQSAVLSWAANANVQSEFDNILKLAEARISRDVRHRRMLTRSVYPADLGSPPVTSRYFALPPNYQAMRTLRLLTANPYALKFRSPDVLPYYQQTVNSTPRYYTVHRQIQLEQPYGWEAQFEMVYYEKIPALVTSSDTNWFLEDFPDLYLRACMLETQDFLRDTEEVVKHETTFNARIAALNEQNADEETPRIAVSSQLDMSYVP